MCQVQIQIQGQGQVQGSPQSGSGSEGEGGASGGGEEGKKEWVAPSWLPTCKQATAVVSTPLRTVPREGTTVQYLMSR